MSADDNELVELEKVLEGLQKQAKCFDSTFEVAKGFFTDNAQKVKVNIIIDILNSAVIISKTSIKEDELKKLIFNEFFKHYDNYDNNKEAEEKVKKLFFKKKP